MFAVNISLLLMLISRVLSSRTPCKFTVCFSVLNVFSLFLLCPVVLRRYRRQSDFAYCGRCYRSVHRLCTLGRNLGRKGLTDVGLGQILTRSGRDLGLTKEIVSISFAVWAQCTMHTERQTVCLSLCPFLPKFCPRVTHPLLIWASETFGGKMGRMVRDSAIVTMETYIGNHHRSFELYCHWPLQPPIPPIWGSHMHPPAQDQLREGRVCCLSSVIKEWCRRLPNFFDPCLLRPMS